VVAKHTPPQDVSFRTSLMRHLGGGAALVALVAVAFYGIGQVGQEPGTPIAADEPQGGDEPEEPDEAEEPEPDEAEEPEPEVPEPDEPDEVEEADPEPEEAEEPEPDDEAGDDDTDTDAGDGDEAEETTAAYAPADISVQVLDGVGTDGGAAATSMAGRLGDAGYTVIAQNPSLAYETTTVLWTSGNEDKARQVAAEIGAGDVRAQPGNLSESVDVHVVVGADRA
jgi:outer membrane biosynthesis protein TonB